MKLLMYEFKERISFYQNTTAMKEDDQYEIA